MAPSNSPPQPSSLHPSAPPGGAQQVTKEKEAGREKGKDKDRAQDESDVAGNKGSRKPIFRSILQKLPGRRSRISLDDSAKSQHQALAGVNGSRGGTRPRTGSTPNADGLPLGSSARALLLTEDDRRSLAPTPALPPGTTRLRDPSFSMHSTLTNDSTSSSASGHRGFDFDALRSLSGVTGATSTTTDGADSDASIRPISPSSFTTSSIMTSGSASNQSQTNRTFKSFVTGYSRSSTKPTTLVSVDLAGATGITTSTGPASGSSMAAGGANRIATTVTSNATANRGTSLPLDPASPAILTNGAATAHAAGTSTTSSSPLLSRSPMGSRDPSLVRPTAAPLPSSPSISFSGLPTSHAHSQSGDASPVSKAGSISGLSIANSIQSPNPGVSAPADPTTTKVPHHSLPHPRNNPHWASVPDDNASLLTLASSTAPRGNREGGGASVMGGPDEDASVRALPPSRRDSGGSIASRWSAAVLSAHGHGGSMGGIGGGGGGWDGGPAGWRGRAPSVRTTATGPSGLANEVDLDKYDDDKASGDADSMRRGSGTQSSEDDVEGRGGGPAPVVSEAKAVAAAAQAGLHTRSETLASNISSLVLGSPRPPSDEHDGPQTPLRDDDAGNTFLLDTPIQKTLPTPEGLDSPPVPIVS